MIKIHKWNDNFRITIEETLEFESREKMEATMKTLMDLKLEFEPKTRKE